MKQNAFDVRKAEHRVVCGRLAQRRRRRRRKGAVYRAAGATGALHLHTSIRPPSRTLPECAQPHLIELKKLVYDGAFPRDAVRRRV